MRPKPLRILLSSALIISFLFPSIALAAPLFLPSGVYLVKDINPSGSSSPFQFALYNGKLFFMANDGTHGAELWVHDGSLTEIVADINPGAGGSGPYYPVVFDGDLYFRADDGVHGQELWKYDGTSASLVADIYTGLHGSNISDMIVYNGVLFFGADEGSSIGDELWKYDGTSVSLVADICQNGDPDFPCSSSPMDFAIYNGKLFFSASLPDVGQELFYYDSNNDTVNLAANIYADPDPLSPRSSSPGWLTVFNGDLYFSATDDFGAELWKYNGTNATQVEDLNSGAPSASPSWLTVYDGELVFSANDGINGEEVWKTNGTTLSMISDINKGPGSSTPAYFTDFNGLLYFRADNVTNGYELWKYDGTSASLAVDIIPGNLAGYPRWLIVFGNSLYFSGYDGAGHGEELMRYTNDTTPPTVTFSSPVNGATIQPTSSLKLTFNEDMKHDGSLGAADYAGNYRLVEANGDGFQVNGCTEDVGDQDTDIVINSASYSNNNGVGPFVVLLKINNGRALPNGMYRLLVCGTTSVEDLAGNKLNGGTDDSIANFTVLAKDSEVLPQTGFPPGVLTAIPLQPSDRAYKDLGDLWFEIPDLGISAPIVGVPVSNDGWDITWLGNDVGWLNGTAFPTWAGNSVLTAHVYDANGQPGLFANLRNLGWGDQVIVHAWDQSYIYEVRSIDQYVDPQDNSVLKHEEFPCLTLITCKDYDEQNNNYRWRIVVRAVQVQVK